MARSSDQITRLLTNSSEGSLYVLMRMLASVGHRWDTLRRATQPFKELKVLLASTRKMALVSSLEKMDLIACTVASMPAI